MTESARNADIPQDKKIVLHCKTGVRSAEVLAVLGRERKRAFLYGIRAIGGVAGGEQHLTGFEPVALRADRQDPQGRRPEPPENRNPLKERDIVLDRHSGRDLRDQLVAARFGDQDGRGSGIFLDLLP